MFEGKFADIGDEHHSYLRYYYDCVFGIYELKFMFYLSIFY